MVGLYQLVCDFKQHSREVINFMGKVSQL